MTVRIRLRPAIVVALITLALLAWLTIDWADLAKRRQEPAITNWSEHQNDPELLEWRKNTEDWLRIGYHEAGDLGYFIEYPDRMILNPYLKSSAAAVGILHLLGIEIEDRERIIDRIQSMQGDDGFYMDLMDGLREPIYESRIAVEALGQLGSVPLKQQILADSIIGLVLSTRAQTNENELLYVLLLGSGIAEQLQEPHRHEVQSGLIDAVQALPAAEACSKETDHLTLFRDMSVAVIDSQGELRDPDCVWAQLFANGSASDYFYAKSLAEYLDYFKARHPELPAGVDFMARVHGMLPFVFGSEAEEAGRQSFQSIYHVMLFADAAGVELPRADVEGILELVQRSRVSAGWIEIGESNPAYSSAELNYHALRLAQQLDFTGFDALKVGNHLRAEFENAATIGNWRQLQFAELALDLLGADRPEGFGCDRLRLQGEAIAAAEFSEEQSADFLDFFEFRGCDFAIPDAIRSLWADEAAANARARRDGLEELRRARVRERLGVGHPPKREFYSSLYHFEQDPDQWGITVGPELSKTMALVDQLEELDLMDRPVVRVRDYVESCRTEIGFLAYSRERAMNSNWSEASFERTWRALALLERYKDRP